MSEQFYEENGFDHPQPEYTPQPPKKERRTSAGKIIALALCFSLIGSVLGAGGTFITMRIVEKVFPKLSANISSMQEGERDSTVIDVTKIDTSKVMTPAEVYAADICTITLNIAGLPGMSVPCGFDSSNNMPVGFQIIGKKFRESDILTVAKCYENAVGGFAVKEF